MVKNTRKMNCCGCSSSSSSNDEKSDETNCNKPDTPKKVRKRSSSLNNEKASSSSSSSLKQKSNTNSQQQQQQKGYSDGKGKESVEQMLGTSPRYRLSSDIYTSPYVSVVRGHLGNKVVAVKIYRLKAASVTLTVMKELERLRAVALNETRLLAIIPYHPNIVRYYMSEDLGDNYHIVCEYCPKSLFDMIERKPLNPKQCKDLFYQLCLGLEHLHDVPVAHRDIKPENLLITWPKNASSSDPNSMNAMLKITDFGFSVQFRDGEKLNVFCGTMLYAAPELIQSVPYDGRASDVWSALVTLHAMASSRSLFGGVDNIEICQRITERPIRFSSIVPPDVVELLRFGLQRDPGDRPTIAGILLHPYFDDYKWSNYNNNANSALKKSSSLMKKASSSTLSTNTTPLLTTKINHNGSLLTKETSSSSSVKFNSSLFTSSISSMSFKKSSSTKLKKKNPFD